MTEAELGYKDREGRTRTAIAAYQGQPIGKMQFGEAGLARYRSWVNDVSQAPEILHPQAQVARGWLYIEAAAAAGDEGERDQGRIWIDKAEEIFGKLIDSEPLPEAGIDEHALVQSRALAARAAIPFYIRALRLHYQDETMPLVNDFDYVHTGALKLLQSAFEQTESIDLLHEIHCQTIVHLVNSFEAIPTGPKGHKSEKTKPFYCRTLPAPPRFRQEHEGSDALVYTYTLTKDNRVQNQTYYPLRISHTPLPGIITVSPVLLLEAKKASTHGLTSTEKLIAFTAAKEVAMRQIHQTGRQASTSAISVQKVHMRALEPVAAAVIRRIKNQIDRLSEPPEKPRFKVAPLAEGVPESKWRKQQFELARTWLDKAAPDLDMTDPDNITSLRECLSAMTTLHEADPLSPQARVTMGWLMAEVAAHSQGLQGFEEAREFLAHYIESYQDAQPVRTYTAREALAWNDLQAQWRNTSPTARREGAGTYQRTIAELSRDLALYISERTGASLNDEMRELSTRLAGVLVLNGTADDEILVTAVPPWRQKDKGERLGRCFALTLLTDDAPCVGHIRVTTDRSEEFRARDSGLGYVDFEELLPNHWPVADVLAALSKRILSPDQLGPEEQALLTWFDENVRPKVPMAITLATY